MFIFIFFLVFGQSGDGLAHLFGFYFYMCPVTEITFSICPACYYY